MIYKKYMVFGFNAYYPDGGLDDVLNSFDDESEAIKCAEKAEFRTVQVFDRVEGNVIFSHTNEEDTD
jgi:hypothetical protein